jgi:hypothetical protein
MAELHWTPRLISDRLAEAADVLAQLPESGPRGYFSLWPLAPGHADRDRAQLSSPLPEAIDRLDEALGWLSWLESEERRLVWLRAEGLPWKRITHRLGIGRTTAWQRWTVALLKIATRLNAAAEQNRPNIKAVNRSGDPVLQTR